MKKRYLGWHPKDEYELGRKKLSWNNDRHWRGRRRQTEELEFQAKETTENRFQIRKKSVCF